jgi:hypothetical protein
MRGAPGAAKQSSAAHGRGHAGLSHGARQTVLAVCLGSLARQRTDYLAMPVLDCLVSAAGLSCIGRRTVLIVSLDTRKTVLRCPRRTVLRRRQHGWAAAAVIARLASGGGDRRRYVCEMDTAHMEQRLRNTIYLYMGYWYLDMGLNMGLDGPIHFD